MYKSIILPLAKEDIKEAAKWYNERQDGLGKRFTEHVRSKVKFIKGNPKAFALISVVVFRDLQVIKNNKEGIRIFKYGLIYITLFTITLFIVRIFRTTSFDGLSIYALVLTLFALFNWVKREREKNSRK